MHSLGLIIRYRVHQGVLTTEPLGLALCGHFTDFWTF